jgi:hypothetical protein
MYRVFTNITIQQLTQLKTPGALPRNKTLYFDFVNEFECADTWRDMTNDGKIIIPKNLYYVNTNGKRQPLWGTNVNIGGFTSSPLLMRGDAVTIDYGYKFFRDNKEKFEGTYNSKKNSHLFTGFISKVTSKKPIEFLIEDNMWKLKQIPVPIHTFKATDTLESILKFLLKGTKYTVNSLTETTFGVFMVGNETVAEVLARLQKQYYFEASFRGDELRCGMNIYIESEAQKHTFTFQHTIISDELDYRRKDDLVLSCVASNKNEEETGEMTKDGNPKTKCNRMEVLITFQNRAAEPTVFIKKKGEDYPPNTGGERIAQPFPGAKSIKELISVGTEFLRKFYYTGFKGKFTTFGIPFVKMGDNVQLIDPVLPERNGLYKVKGVEYSGGMGGLRQVIELHYRILV